MTQEDGLAIIAGSSFFTPKFGGIMLLGFIIGIFIGYLIGWWNAHHTVANECKRLGKFYVGKETFECVKIEEKK